MKKYALAAISMAAMLFFASCQSTEKNPVEEALYNKMIENNPNISFLQISSIETVKDVSLGDEINRRSMLFESKVKAEQKVINECIAKSNATKLKEHTLKQEQAKEILEELGKYVTEHQASLDSVIYHVVKFKASGKMNDGAVIGETIMYATMDNGLNVHNLQKEGGNIYTGMGSTIPGYRDILKSTDIE